MPRREPPALVPVLCLVVVAIYAALALGRPSEIGEVRPADAYYNLLVRGFGKGHLYVDREAPPGLVALADPYDPDANADFRGFIYTSPERIHDLSYFQGHLYLYFGVVPALVLFWPFAALTGGYLTQGGAVWLFSSAGFLLGSLLLRSAWRRYFSASGVLPLVAAIVSLGLGSGFPIVLNRPDVWEVPIASGFAWLMAALGAVWMAVLRPQRRAVWTTIAGLACGLALGSRPSLLACTLVLALPVIRARAEGAPWREAARLLAAGLIPVALIGTGLLLYNQLRFGNPFEFGQHYQLAGDRQDRGHFALSYFWFNFRAYFLAPAGLSTAFPFVDAIRLPQPPAGFGSIESPYGILVNMPFTLFALVLPLAWKRGALPVNVRGLAGAIVAYLVPTTLLLCLFYGTSSRYQLEMTPAFMLLGGLALMSLVAAREGRRASALRVACAALAAVSLCFNAFAAAKYRGEMDAAYGGALLADGQSAEAVPVLETALRRNPRLTAARMDLAIAYDENGRGADGSVQIGEALARDPTAAPAIYRSYAPVLMQLNRDEDVEAIQAEAVRVEPDTAALRNDHGAVLARLGREAEATREFEEALRLEPENADALANLGVVAMRAGRLSEAKTLFERALRSNPDQATARNLLQRLP